MDCIRPVPTDPGKEIHNITGEEDKRQGERGRVRYSKESAGGARMAEKIHYDDNIFFLTALFLNPKTSTITATEGYYN